MGQKACNLIVPTITAVENYPMEREEEFILAHSFGMIHYLHLDWKKGWRKWLSTWWQDCEAGCLHLGGSGRGCAVKLQAFFPAVHFLCPGPVFLRFPMLPTKHTTGGQVFKIMSLWRTFYTQTITTKPGDEPPLIPLPWRQSSNVNLGKSNILSRWTDHAYLT